MAQKEDAAPNHGAKLSQGVSLPLRVADLPGRRAQHFALTPDAEARAELAARLRIEKVRKLSFEGEIRPARGEDWELRGALRATVVQACVVSGEPVTTRIEVPVARSYLRDLPEPTEAEVEMPEDDTLEPLRAVIDPGEVMAEALALELPDYPRATDASLDGVAGLTRDPLPDERPNPFAALAGLKAEMDGQPSAPDEGGAPDDDDETRDADAGSGAAQEDEA